LIGHAALAFNLLLWAVFYGILILAKQVIPKTTKLIAIPANIPAANLLFPTMAKTMATKNAKIQSPKATNQPILSAPIPIELIIPTNDIDADVQSSPFLKSFRPLWVEVFVDLDSYFVPSFVLPQL
jgi:hypothetical protein